MKIYFSLPWSPQNKEIRYLIKNAKAYKKIEKKYKNDIDKNIVCKDLVSDYVFTCWFQGEDNAPELVKACLNSIRKNFSDKKVVVITKENMNEYVDLPGYIMDKWEKHKISHAHMSDILRVELLSKYGGLWIDSTVLCTGDLSRYVDEHTELFVFSNEYRGDASSCLSNWLIYSKPNNPIIVNTRNLLFKYWKTNNKVINYFIFHILFTISARYMPEEWDKVKFFTNIEPHLLQFRYLKKEFNAQEFDELKRISSFHKLTYKVGKLSDNSFYNKICKGGGLDGDC